MHPVLFLALGLVAGLTDARAAAAGSGMQQAAAPQQSIADVQQAASRLRESIAQMKGKAGVADREQAIGRTREALTATQRALAALPAEIRNAPGAGGAATRYDQSVERLTRAADVLRESVQAMAKLPAGDFRNKALRQAHQALLEADAAMVQASGPAEPTRSMGAGEAPMVSGCPGGATPGAADGTPADAGSASGDRR